MIDYVDTGDQGRGKKQYGADKKNLPYMFLVF